MFNVIKMDLYKMFKMRSFYIINIIVALLLVDIVQGDITRTEATVGDGLTVAVAEDSIGNLLSVYGDLLSSGMCQLFGVIFVVMFVADENENGYIKNIAGQVKYRRELFVSKLVVIGIYTIITDVFWFTIEAATWLIFKGDFGDGSFKRYIMYTVFQVLLQYTFMAVFVTISAITKSKVVSMVAAVCMALGTGGLLCRGIDVAVKKIAGVDVAFEKYLITTQMGDIAPEIGGVQERNVAILIITYLAVIIIAGMINMEKRDIV